MGAVAFFRRCLRGGMSDSAEPAPAEGVGGYATTGAPPVGAEWKFRKLRGEYKLHDFAGKYFFEPKPGEEGELKTEEDGVVGRFVWKPIQAAPEPLLNWERTSFGKIKELQSEPSFIKNSEIMKEIQKAENEGALFVLPSQLNGAEYPSHNSVVTMLEDYKFDNTGGPRGQLAVHPAAGQFVLDNAANEDIDGGRGGINAIDVLLQDPTLGEGFRLQNGYLEVKPGDFEKRREAFKSKLHTLRPLVMEDVPATGLVPSKKEMSQAKHKVGLVYASAVPVNTYLNRAMNEEEKAHQNKIAEYVLKAQYYGALKHAAGSEGKMKRKVFLMPLGGGVFNNAWELIARSMATAIEMLEPADHAKLEIHALTWEGNPKEKNTLLDELDKL